MTWRSLWIGAALLAAQSAAPPPQQPDRRPTFRSATALVEVDIIAQDRNGRFAPNLTAADFEVFEDGRPQTIDHFYLVTRQRGAAPSASAPRDSKRDPDRTERRVFVFFFDSDHLSSGPLLKLKNAAMSFVNAEMRPDDFGGVYVGGELVNGHLTNQKQELLDAIRHAEPATENVETRMRALLEFPRIGSYQEAAQIESGDRGTLADAGQRACGGDEARLCAAEGGREFVEDKLQRKARLFVDQARHAAGSTLRSLSYVVRNLAGLEGRKTLVLLSEGFVLDDARSNLPQLAGQASRAGVTIYCLDARGTAARGGTAPAVDPTLAGPGLSGTGDSSDEALDVLSAQTGGLTLRRRDDFRSALADIGNDTSTYYVLAYTPQNPALDGTYRQIGLTVKIDGVAIRARRGYVASPLPPPKAIRTR
jgi:VWFA-related protein